MLPQFSRIEKGHAKAGVRKDMLARRRALAPDEAHARSHAAQLRLMAQPLWQQAQVLCLYVALPEETATDALLEAAWGAGKTVLLPRVCPRKPDDRDSAGRMDMVACAGPQDLAPGAYGIREPLPALPAWDVAHSPDLFVLPGVAFDRQGQRLGFGGGFYDRFVSRTGWACPRVGLCFAVQVLAAFAPGVCEAWDMGVNYLCTEDAWLTIA